MRVTLSQLIIWAGSKPDFANAIEEAVLEVNGGLPELGPEMYRQWELEHPEVTDDGPAVRGA